MSDHIDGALAHLTARDVTMAMVSRAPLAKIEAFKKRMGWRFNWVSSYGSKFNADFHASFTREEMAQGKVNYNYTMQQFPSAEAPGISVHLDNDCGSRYKSRRKRKSSVLFKPNEIRAAKRCHPRLPIFNRLTEQ
jgi:predicted dithiol-disulfide oxidoreductase (DUF899 family)